MAHAPETPQLPQILPIPAPPDVLSQYNKRKSGPGDDGPGFIERTPGLYAKVEALGVPARVWDQVIEIQMGRLATYGVGYHSMTPPAFDQLLQDYWLGWRMLDYTRADGVCIADYALGLLTQADARIRASRQEHVGADDSDEHPFELAHEEAED